MARKKIVFVIVEGPSDEEALGLIFSKIYSKEEVYVEITRCDITSELGITTDKISANVGELVRDYAKRYHFSNENFKEIIHIIDTDGAFISDENVVEDSKVNSPVYSLTEIRTYNKSGIEKRNKNKSLNINKLCSTSKIWDIPYRAFYMSMNLDHVLYNKLNSSDDEKEEDSFKFALKYKDDIPGFLNFISNSDFSVVTNYKDSWEFIKKDLNSLQRHTNLGLCFKENE